MVGGMKTVRHDVKHALEEGTHVVPEQEHRHMRGHQVHLDITEHTDPNVVIAVDFEVSIDGGKTWTYGGGFTRAGYNVDLLKSAMLNMAGDVQGLPGVPGVDLTALLDRVGEFLSGKMDSGWRVMLALNKVYDDAESAQPGWSEDDRGRWQMLRQGIDQVSSGVHTLFEKDTGEPRTFATVNLGHEPTPRHKDHFGRMVGKDPAPHRMVKGTVTVTGGHVSTRLHVAGCKHPHFDKSLVPKD